ncbi:MAG: hypothetical protein H6613_15630 [Ignavibacteriales bacterium]|nr:hypothetical protein [Ignavibacteriales bacterium]
MHIYQKHIFYLIALFLINVSVFAQDNEKIEIYNLYPGDLEHSAFEVLEYSTVHIKGKAANYGGNLKEKIVFYGWLIDSKTRQIVWDAREDFDFEDEDGMFDFDDLEPLEAGTYEVYYTCNNGNDIDIKNFKDFISKVLPGRNDFRSKNRPELGITVSGEEGKFRVVDFQEVINNVMKNSIVSINRVKDNEDLEAGFSLKDKTTIRIYSIGEGSNESIIDLAWISDVKTNQIVWKASLDKSTHAGGGKKNYVINEKIELPKGSYQLHYSSDDSHSFEDWNVMPPNDPLFWGATIWADSEKDKNNVVQFKVEDVIKPMVELTKVGDSQYLSQGFKLLKSTEIKILCLGEGTDGDDLSDYGWIVNADTKELVWSMNNNKKLEHAGGTKKNRMVNETIILEKGNYIAYYSTDDSHSYEDWNASAPFDRTRWGLTIWAGGKDFELFDSKDYKSKNIIAEIIKVKDNEDIEKAFTLSKDSKIRIFAIGEGTRSGMDDYGWIEDSEGDVVWEMTYNNTEKAGGASKNKLFNKIISLDAGNYTLHFITDGSHSYNSWNSAPPENQDSYGISLFSE